MREKRPFFILSLLLILALVGCAIDTSDTTAPTAVQSPTLVPTPEPPKQLRLVFWQAPEVLNPHLSVLVKDVEVSRMVFEPLASYNDSAELAPVLAAEIPSLQNGGLDPNGRFVIWRLREDVQWADGEPFTAADVKFTYDYIMNPAVGSTSMGFYDNIDRVEILDDYTVRLDFKTVEPAWTLPFVGPEGVILPEHIFSPYNNEDAANAPPNSLPIGTGPFYAVENDPQEVLFLGDDLVQTNRILFRRNPYFREEGKPYFDEIIVEGGGSPLEAARLVFEDDEADVAWNLSLSPQQLEAYQDVAGRDLLITFVPRVEHLALNHTDPDPEAAGEEERSTLQHPHPFWQDKRVRQALSYAIDRRRIAALYGLAGRPVCNNLVLPEIYASDNTTCEFDLEQATALLDEAGIVDSDGDGVRDRDGKEMVLSYLSVLDPIVQETQEIIRSDLAQIGVRVEKNPVAESVFYGPPGNLNQGNGLLFYADLSEYFLENPSPEPSIYMSYWTCDQIPQPENNWLAGLNIPRWCDPESGYNDLYQRLLTELDPEIRRELVIEMNEILVEEVVTIPLVHLAEVSGVRDDIEGIVSNPWDGLLWNVQDWRRTSQ